MKKILYFVSLCLIMFPLGSCSRFLEEVSPTSLSEATVYNTPEATLGGRDLQLEAAVAEMLKEIGQK